LMVTVGKIPTESETIATHWNIWLLYFEGGRNCGKPSK
jgi:hypothetical protein